MFGKCSLCKWVILFESLLLCSHEPPLFAQQVFKIDSLTIVSRKELDAADIRVSHDSLYVLSEDNRGIFAFPFGKYRKFLEIKTRLPSIKIESRTKYFSDSGDSLRRLEYEISLGRSFVKFFEGADDGLYYVNFGRIVDSAIVFPLNIKVGMSEKDLLLRFFKDVPTQLLERVNIIKIQPDGVYASCYYVCEKGILELIYFEADGHPRGDDVGH